MSKVERVAKLMAARGLCSRREAERLIEAGQVRVDGVVVREQGVKTRVEAVIEIADAGRALLGSRLSVVLNKPAGVVSVLPGQGQVPAWRLLKRGSFAGPAADSRVERVLAAAERLAVAGRLDRASRGLLVLTEDGALARRIVGSHEIEKTYQVCVSPLPTASQIEKLRGPLFLDGVKLRPMRVERLGPDRLRFVLTEGRKHQIRRVCRKVGLNVTDLLREAVGPILLGNLPEGHWRFLSEQELRLLRGASG